MEKKMKKILYRKRKLWKYKLESATRLETGLLPNYFYDIGFLRIVGGGTLTIRAGYCWDGPSGPTVDSSTGMRASLFHDALYQLIREGVLPESARKQADELLYQICIEDGMNKVRAWAWYKALRLAGKKATKSEIKTAP